MINHLARKLLRGLSYNGRPETEDVVLATLWVLLGVFALILGAFLTVITHGIFAAMLVVPAGVFLWLRHLAREIATKPKHDGPITYTETTWHG